MINFDSKAQTRRALIVIHTEIAKTKIFISTRTTLGKEYPNNQAFFGSRGINRRNANVKELSIEVSNQNRYNLFFIPEKASKF